MLAVSFNTQQVLFIRCRRITFYYKKRSPFTDDGLGLRALFPNRRMSLSRRRASTIGKFRPHRLPDHYSQNSQHQYEENYHHHDNNDHTHSMHQSSSSPTMMLEAKSNNNTTSTTSPTTTTTTTMMMNTSSNSHEDDGDDLTLGYETPIRRRSRRSTEQSTPPTECVYKYTASPSSESRPCRTLSLLDYCQQEVVSPLSSPSLLSLEKLHYDDLLITTVPSFAEDEDKDSLAFSHTTIMGHEDTIMNRCDFQDPEVIMMVNENTTLSLETIDSNNVISGSKRRGSRHNRSQFLLDGNFSFDSASPPPVPVYPSSPCLTITAATSTQTPIFYSSPIIPTGTGTLTMMISPSDVVTPPQQPRSQHPPFTFDCNQGDCIMEKYDEGWKAPPKPPTHTEQRRRNKAMPSIQYADLILHRLSQQHQEQE